MIQRTRPLMTVFRVALVIAGAMIAGWSRLLAADPPVAGANSFLPQIDLSLKFQGATSCASSACHGGQQPDARPNYILRNEYSIWSDRDPHARAYRSLSNPRSQQILTRLGIQPGDTRYQNCLTCHNPQQWGNERDATLKIADLTLDEGVNCESCHGPAERWRTKHYRQDWDANESERLGMVDTSNPLIQARLCADCHVGSAQRQVNHDLLAAGHPALWFDYPALLQRMPTHWNARVSPASIMPAIGDESLAWQLAGSDAALELLAARTGNASRGAWPEFATARCTSCHHQLGAAGPAATQQANTSIPASRYDGDFFTNFFTSIETKTADAKPDSIAHSLHSSLSNLRLTMNAHVVPDPAVVRGLATSAHQQLHQWVAGLAAPR
jgi:hypothetical protein